MADTLTPHVLDYWHSIEFFNHYDLGEQIKEARSDDRAGFFLSDSDDAEWNLHRSATRNIYLLPFNVSEVTALALARSRQPRSELERWRDDESAPEGRTCFAKLRVNSDGVPDLQGLSLSTLPWAGGMVLQERLRELCADEFEASVMAVREQIASAWSALDDIAITPDFCRTLAALLTQWAGFAPSGGLVAWVDVVEERRRAPARQASLLPPQHDVDVDAVAAAQELPILNSFFYHDLKYAAAALRHEGAPHPLRAYLAARPHDKLDLDSPDGELAIHAALDPALGNEGRWPMEPGMLQSLMQQFALNKMRALPPGGLLSVNGPPGTGKTTLVKDLIADLLVRRAGVLAQLSKATDGLAKQGATIAFSNQPALTIPLLIPELRGFEIIVASSNNGAVENLSLELPQLSGLAGDRRQTLRYFHEMATKYAGTRAGKPWKPPLQPVWGLMSAALGKKANRDRFQQVFVYCEKRPGERPGERYLPISQVDLTAWEDQGAMNYWRFMKQKKSAVPSFDSAKRRFVQANAELAAYGASQHALRSRWLEFVAAWQAARGALGLSDGADADDLCGAPLRELDARLRKFEGRLEQLELRLWPAMLRWLMRWFGKRTFADWLQARAQVLLAADLRGDLEMVLRLQQKTGQLQLWDGQPLDSQRNQAKALWHGAAYNELRNELFAAAMELHQAFFIEAAGNDVGKAVGSLLSARQTSGSPLPVWQWLFMLVPVVSSTFASVRSQFRAIEPGSLGWLIIDEAGQAVPQAAVGALLRVRRAVVLGDPLQIEPVVGIPARLIDELGQVWLGADAARYAAHRHSVQTLADRAHAYGVRHPQRRDEFIGVPLVMHRRCANPMFAIANRIAYDGRMRHDTPASNPAGPHPVLGSSAWWDIGGTASEGKYVKRQGEHLFERLLALYLHAVRQGGNLLPTVYVITPFREVKRGLLALLGNKLEWARRLPDGVAVPVNLAELRSHIGTVHTFQGKEADTVFFVLGCDASHGGAMRWASNAPNLLNVAVTRARKHCYLIGDKALWGELPFFQTARDEMDRFQRTA